MSTLANKPTTELPVTARSIINRLAWKETALLRPICIACLVLLGLILIFGQGIFNNAIDYTEFVGNATMSLGCIAALGLAIPMFVLERESGTDTFLESFPVDGRQVSNTKLTRTIIHFVAFMIAAILLGFTALAIHEGGMPSFAGKRAPLIWANLIVLIPTQCLLWALVCSLTFRSGLHATIFAAGLTLVSSIALSVIATGWKTGLAGQNDMLAIIGTYTAACVLLAGVVWYLSPSWLRGRNRTTTASVAKKHAVVANANTAYPWQALFWQNMRQCRIAWGIAAIAALLGSYCIGYFVQYDLYYIGNVKNAALNAVNYSTPLFVLTGAWIGTLMFSDDQSKSNFMFFQQRADYPRRIWLSRLCIVLFFLPIVWLGAALMLSIISTTVLERSMDARNLYMNEHTSLSSLTNMLNLTVIFLAAAGLAQLSTMLFRIGSGFISFIVTVVLSCLLIAFCLEITRRGESILIFLAPTTIACFAASWWHAPRWISGRAKKRGAFVAIAACGFVVAASCSGWIWHRLTELREPAKGSLVAEWIAFSEADNLVSARAKYPAAAKLEKAIQNLIFTDEEQEASTINFTRKQSNEWFLRNSEILAEISEQLRDKDCGLFLNPRSNEERNRQKGNLIQTLEAVSRRHFEQQDVGLEFEALEDRIRATWFVSADPFACEPILLDVCDWAARENNDEATIRAAIETIEELELEILSPASEVLFRESTFEIQRQFQTNGVSNRDRDFWWEVERNRRWNLHLLSADSPWRSDTRSWLDPNEPPGVYYDQTRDPRWRRSNPGGARCKTTLQSSGPMLAVLRNMLRYTKTRLALAGWKLANQSWPERLEQLCEGDQPWFESLPLSSFSEREFAYSGTGADDKVFCEPERSTPPLWYYYNAQQERYATTVPETQHWIEPKQPFLLPWSGVIGEKRSFVPMLYDAEAEGIRPTKKATPAYWIPPGPARAGNLLPLMERYLLD